MMGGRATCFCSCKSLTKEMIVLNLMLMMVSESIQSKTKVSSEVKSSCQKRCLEVCLKENKMSIESPLTVEKGGQVAMMRSYNFNQV